MELAFIIDPIESLNFKKDSSCSMMRVAHARGHSVFTINHSDLSLSHGIAFGLSHNLTLTDNPNNWYEIASSSSRSLASFDAVLMRKDPPVNSEYLYATFLLEVAENNGAKVFNSASSLRNMNEKLSILNFPKFIAPTIVSKDQDFIREFIEQEEDVILKPLDSMGGSSIFRITSGDLNTSVILETMTKAGTKTIMGQKFIREIELGDKRVIIVNGQAMPFSLARIPKKGEIRGNLVAGGKGLAMPLTPREIEIATCVSPYLLENGVIIAGLDIIGNFLTEINITSPTCMNEIKEQTGWDSAKKVIEEVELLVKNSQKVSTSKN